MSSISITTSDTILFSSTDVFFFTIQKNIPSADEVLVWFDITGNSQPQYWKIERDFNCSDYINQGNAFRIQVPIPSSENDNISLALSLKQDVELPKFTKITINCRISSRPEIATTTIYYQSTYSPYSSLNEVYDINPNYNMPFSSDGTKQLLRTNPKLTGNIKITIDSNQNVWLNTIDANLELASTKFKKYKVSGDGSYPYDVRKLLDEGRLDSKTLYFIENQDDDSVKTTNSAQYKSFYWSGADYLPSLLYDEEFSFFAPLWIDQNIPDFFVVFASNGVVSDNTKSNSQNFKDVIINNSKIVKVYSLKQGTILGNYIRSIINSNVYNPSPIKVNYENIKSITYRGIDYKNGIYTEKNEIIEDLVLEDTPISFFENKIIEGFEKNNLISYNLLNLEFLFNNTEAYEFDINRYFGFYVNETELSKFIIDEKGFSDNYPDIPTNKVKVHNESSFELHDNNGINIIADLTDSKIPSSELIKESDHIFYIKGKYNLYKIKDSEIIDTSGDKFFTRPSGKILTSQNFLEISDITGFSGTKFIAKSEIKENVGFPFDIKFNNGLKDSDSISIIYQKGNIQKEWKVIANSYLVSKSSTLEQEVIKEPISLNLISQISSIETFSEFNIGKLILPEILDFSIGTYIFLDYNYTILGATTESTQTITLTSGINTFTAGSITNISINQPITGIGIPLGSYITSINSSTNVVTINNTITANGSQSITFNSSILLKGNQASLVADGDTILIKDLLNDTLFNVEISSDEILNSSQNTIVPIITNSYVSDISENPSNYGAKLTSSEYSDEAKIRRCEVSDISFDYDNTRTILYIKDPSKLVINNTTASSNIVLNISYSNQYIFNYFNPNGSTSEYLDSIISAFNTFDYKKFTISKKESGILIRSEFETDALFKLKIDLTNNHTLLSDVLLNDIESKGFKVGYDSTNDVDLYKKMIFQEFIIPKKRYAFTIPSEFSKNITGEEWLKSNNGNKQLHSSFIQEIKTYYYNTESSSTIELELLDSVPPELDKESNAVFYNLHKNSIGVMSFLPIVDFDTDFLDSDYSYLPSEELKLYYYRFQKNEKLPMNQVYRIFSKVGTVISLFAVLTDGTEIQIGLTKLTANRTITLDTTSNFLILHTIPALHNQLSATDDVSHFYYTTVESVVNSNTTYLQNATSFLTSKFTNTESPILDEEKLNQFQGFNGLYDFLDSGELEQIEDFKRLNYSEKFSYALLRSEYEKLRENFNKDLFNKSRTLPYINKWVIKNSSDIRSNEYRFNVSLAFGDKGLIPDNKIQTPSSIICHTHEWFYIEGIPSWYSSTAVENDRIYTFSKVTDEDLLSSEYDGFSRCFIRGSHKEKYQGNVLNTDTRNLFTYVTYDKITNKAFVFFKGARFELIVDNPSIYANWRFTAVLRSKKRSPYTNDNNIETKFIENKKWRTITFVIDAHLESYSFPEREINLLGLYVLDSAKNIAISPISDISYPLSRTFIFKNSDLQLVGGLNPTFTNSKISGDIIKINTTADLSPQIKPLENGSYNDIRAFGWGNRAYNVIYDNKGVYLQFFGNNLHKINNDSLEYKQKVINNDSIGYEFSLFSNPIPLNERGLPSVSSVPPNAFPVHINYTQNIAVSFKNSASYYIKSGYNSLKEILRKLSFSSILEILSGKEYSYVVVDESGVQTEYVNYSGFTLNYIEPISILKKSLLQPYPETDVPTQVSLNEIIGYSLSQTDYDFEITRYGGDFIPRTKDIIKFSPSESVTFIEEFTNCDKPNTRFLPNSANFGIIKNLGFHKVSDKKILTLADTAYSSSYPLIDETGIDYRDFNVISSTWDYDYYRLYSDKNDYTSLKPIVETTENKTFFGSKLITTPNTLLLEDFSFTDYKDTSKDFWYEIIDGIINIHLYSSNMILKCLSKEELRNKLKASIRNLRDESLFNEDFFEEYILLNLVKIYKIASIKLFVRGSKITQDIILNTTDLTRNELGFVQDNGISIDTRVEDVLIKRNISELSNGQISLSILFDKI
jgi:hypothetical protein